MTLRFADSKIVIDNAKRICVQKMPHANHG